MSEAVCYPSNRHEYALVLSEVSRVLDLEARIPGWPFRADVAHADFLQFIRAMGGSFGRVLQSLSDYHGDDTVSFAVLDPDAPYYLRRHGVYPIFRVAAGNVADSYGRLVRHALSAAGGSVQDDAGVIAMTGSSGRWAVWGEWFWDIAIVVSDSDERPWTQLGLPFLTAEEAWVNLMDPEHGPGQPARIRETFLANSRLRGTGPV